MTFRSTLARTSPVRWLRLSLVTAWLLAPVGVLFGAEQPPSPEAEATPLKPEFTTVVAKDAGLWPQLQIASDGMLLAFGYNSPSHTTLPADVDCWASDDGGRSWSKHGTAAPRPAMDANYCHWASGFSEKQELLVIVSGMDDAANARGKRQPNDVRVFRSADFGKTWRAEGDFPTRLPGELKPYPFGSIVRGSDGALRTLVYSVDEQHANVEATWMMISRDDGRSWGEPVKVADGINESVLMPLAGRDWLCVARTSNRPAPELGQELRQFRSKDDGRTWIDEGLIAGYHKHPPHLLRLKDQRLLLTYGNRRDGSIEARLSENDGQTWGTTHKLYTTGPGDMGYPSTAQLPDGKLVTVFYAIKSPLHDRYHMGAIGWTAPPALPQVDRVDAQPLLLLTRRLVEALDTNGAPLSKETKDALSLLKDAPDDAHVTATVQRLLDPLCIAAVEIAQDGTTRAVAGRAVEVEENGWRTVLVKVLNRAGVQSRLRVDSPQARPIPHGPLDDVANRWLSLNAYDGRPLDATLSGLELEYRLVQISSTRTGARTARLEFNAGVAGAKGSQTIRQWKFDKDADGWAELNDLKLEVRDKALHLQATGGDPYFSAPVQARGGKMVLRFWGETDSSDIGQVYWWTEQLPQPDGQRQMNFQLNAGRDQEYAIEFSVEGDLRGVRIDPLQGEGKFRIEWISLEYAAGENGTWGGADITVHTLPSTKVTFQVVDADGSPCMGCFEIRDAQGRVYPAQPKRQAPDFFFQTQIYRESGEVIRLPPGAYQVVCSHGPESVPETKLITVGEEPLTVDYRVRRWIDTAKLGYWSGDHHIHAAGCLHYENPTQGVHPPDMLRHIMGEDVKVGCCLTWGPCFDYQKQFFRGQPDDVSRYPYLLRYDIEVSGFGSHQSGHLNLLKLSEQIPEGGDSKTHWPTLGLNTLRWAKKQGAVTGTAHSGAGLERSVGRVPGDDGAHKLPSFAIPAFDGIGANEFIMQVTHQVPGVDGKPVPALDFIATMNTPRELEWNIWYHVLNCGIPVVASGETDFPCMTGERVGIGRVYVKLDGKLDYNDWAEALRRGESYVSNGTSHLLNFARQPDGSFVVEAAARLPESPEIEVELIANGLPIAVQKLRADGEQRTLKFADPKFTRSSWVAARIFPSAHTNPIWIKVDDKPVCVKSSVVWCLAALEQCWKEKKRTYAAAEKEQAETDYEHARQTFRKMLDESAP